jgi:hypothetical protein
MAAGPYVKQLTESLRDTEQRWLMSMAIDEIERETYWETRQEMLYRIQTELNSTDGDINKLVDYMLSKEKPE